MAHLLLPGVPDDGVRQVGGCELQAAPLRPLHLYQGPPATQVHAVRPAGYNHLFSAQTELVFNTTVSLKSYTYYNH